MSQDISCRLCVGFIGFPELPSTMKVSSKKKAVKVENDNDLQDSDIEDKPKPSKSKKKEEKVMKKPSNPNYWVEFFDEAENDWVPAHPKNENICSIENIEKYSKFNYALGIDKDFNVLDMTGWYAEDFLLLKFRKTRVEDGWIQSFLNLPAFCSSRKHVAAENQKLQNHLKTKPLPKVVAEYKNHPLYAIEKDLLKFEAFYPPDLKPLGKVRQYDVYPRSGVFTLQGELNWIRQARNVKEEEKDNPYKVVKARPKLSIPAEERVPLFLNTYGYWQTEPYVPGDVVDGKIPRNEFNNVYMYRPEMVPNGCVHLKEKGVLAMARTLNLEAVGAVTGWEFSGGRNHPTIEGCVVLEKDAEILRSACLEWQEIKKQKKIKAEQNRGLLLWKRLVKGAVLLKNLKERFNVN